MEKYKFDLKKLYSLCIFFICFVLLFFSDTISQYVMVKVKEEIMPVLNKCDKNEWSIIQELIPATGMEMDLFYKGWDYGTTNNENSESEVMYLAEQYYNNQSNLVYQEDIVIEENIVAESLEEDHISGLDTEVHVEATATEEIENEDVVMETSTTPVSSAVTYSIEQLSDFEFLVSNCYLVDSSTSVNPDELDASNLLGMDMSVDLSGEDYKVLIYHTHGSESFIDSRPGVTEDTVIGVGDELTRLLESYGIKVYHDRNIYDMVDGVLDRSYAYDLSGDSVDDILAQYPSIEVVIDLHRDGVRDDLHLVKDINGLPTAQIMFVNGVSRLNVNGDIDYLYNPNKISNLAFSLQMYLEGKATYGDLMRRIYIRGYCFNLDKMPRAALVEVGAQTNTVQEAKNAMIPLANIIYNVLSGSE